MCIRDSRYLLKHLSAAIVVQNTVQWSVVAAPPGCRAVIPAPEVSDRLYTQIHQGRREQRWSAEGIIDSVVVLFRMFLMENQTPYVAKWTLQNGGKMGGREIYIEWRRENANIPVAG